MTAPRITWDRAFPLIDTQINSESVHNYDFDPQLPVDVRFLLFDKINNIRTNRHDYFEVVYLNEGNLNFQILDSHYAMKKGDLIVVGSTVYHTVAVQQNRQKRGRTGAGAKASVLYFLPDFIKKTSMVGDDIIYMLPFMVQDNRFEYIIPARTGLPAEIFKLMKQINLKLPSRSNIDSLAVQTHLKSILVRIASYYSGHLMDADIFTRRQKMLEKLHPVFVSMEKKLDRRITSENAAKISGMSYSHFKRFFKKATGQNFTAYLNGFRIAKAQAMLKKSDDPIARIALRVGFCDQSYFGFVFQKMVGISPGKYRVEG